jgi:hypothetical protein
MLEEHGTKLYPRFEKAYSELLQLLSVQQRFDSVLPLPEDVNIVKEKDPSFPQVESEAANVEASDRNISNLEAYPQTPTETETTNGSQTTEYNPWANPNMIAVSKSESVAGEGNAAEDSDEDLYL